MGDTTLAKYKLHGSQRGSATKWASTRRLRRRGYYQIADPIRKNLDEGGVGGRHARKHNLQELRLHAWKLRSHSYQGTTQGQYGIISVCF